MSIYGDWDIPILREIGEQEDRDIETYGGLKSKHETQKSLQQCTNMVVVFLVIKLLCLIIFNVITKAGKNFTSNT